MDAIRCEKEGCNARLNYDGSLWETQVCCNPEDVTCPNNELPIDAPSRYVEKLEQGKDIQGYGTGLPLDAPSRNFPSAPVDHEIEDEPLDIEIQDDPSLEDHTPCEKCGAPTYWGSVCGKCAHTPETQAPYDAVKNPPHYAQYAIQPIEFIIKNNIGYCVGNVIKYVCRYNLKDGIQDLKKAREYIDIMIKAAEEKGNE